MKVYIDTSVLVAYYCPESLSKKAEQIMKKNPQPAISALTEVELFSAISRKVQEGTLERTDGDRIIAKFFDHMDGGIYEKFFIKTHHYRLARDWIGQFKLPLRSLDAIHLAVASLEDCKFVTADKNLTKSAKALGVDVLFLKI
ncbi:hypothetical protein MNBD_UNCLBAC01-1923 [hydrothermal vent metagenome]|uniref:PIN domain-containing protein n=1 Tax=hydrothermal vent metagenome TaxID=652676 RepID=A0A3B1DFQ5_9ZZZZ